MKRILGFAIILSSLSIPAFAAKSQDITISNPVTVGSTQLPAGDYKITWTGTAPDVQVTIAQKNTHKPVTATVPARLVTEKHDLILLTTSTKAGAKTLETLELKDATLTFTSTPVSGQ
jgi:Protein of unknown function (DUF2911)